MGNLINETEIKSEIYSYNTVANNIVGIVFVNLFLGSISTDSPQATAILLLPVAIGALYIMFSHYPKSINTLLLMLKDKIYEKERVEIENILKQIKKENLNFKSAFTINLVYMCGLVLYSMVLLVPNLGLSIKSGIWMMNLLSYFQITPI